MSDTDHRNTPDLPRSGSAAPRQGIIRGALVTGAIVMSFGTTAMIAMADVPDGSTTISPAREDGQGYLVHDVQSPFQEGTTRIRVLLPARIEANRRLRVLYVLPVEARDGKQFGDGLEECRKLNVHDMHDLIVVSPTFSELPWYADHPTERSIRQETYFVRVVVPFIDKTYPTVDRPDGRLLVGFSKSGWGAFSLLLRHPELFGRAAAWDAPLMKERPDQFHMDRIFGSQDNFRQYQLSRLVKAEEATFRNEPRLFHFGFGNFRDHHRRFESLLVAHSIAHRYHDGPRRAHRWGSGWLPEAIAELLQ